MKSIKYILVLLVFVVACKAKYPTLEDGLYADIQTNRGDILVELYLKEVPLTVANFVSLAEGNNPKLADSIKGKAFYDGTKFHRVIKDFMIQGGDPTGTGRGNAGYKFADEFPLNEEGELIYKHNDKGILSMANSGPATNSSQFFITHKPTPWLDSKHSIFGKVQIGQTVVDSIKKDDYIKKIDIIRVGNFAKKFNAAEVFEFELSNTEKREEERLQKLKIAAANKLKKFEEDRKIFEAEKGIAKAIKTPSGLKILKLNTTNGKKTVVNKPIQMHYVVSLANGKKIQSSRDGGTPFTFRLDDENRPLIAGVKEGVLAMRQGEKAILFIPYYLGYGMKAVGPFPAKSDIVFEVEILKVGK